MRRFFVWSALAAVIGLLLALAGAWAYNHFYARFLPVTVTRNQAEIQRLLDEVPWVSAGGGAQIVYVIGYRDSEALQRYQAEEVAKLAAGGVETRFILFARPDREGQAQSTAAERATVAELWLSRDWSLFQRWTATPARNWAATGVPAADGDLARTAVVDAGRQFADRLGEALGSSGLSTRYPLIIWRDRDGFMKACACVDSRSWPFIRDDLGAPEIGMVATSPEPDATASQPEPLPYPAPRVAPPSDTALPAIPPLPGENRAAPPAAVPAPPATKAPANRPTTPPGKLDDDTTFY